MTAPSPRHKHVEALHEHAAANLHFIRRTMEGATAFTGVSGKGYVLAGLTALCATWLAERQETQLAWLAVWLGELVIATVVCFYLTRRKTLAQGQPLWSTGSRRLLHAFIPAMAVGGLLTLALLRQEDLTLLPGIWLAVYGAAVVTAGLHSVRIIPVMGALFMVMGALALLSPLPAAPLLALGFGGLHMLFGILVWRRHGG